ncbi:hypothetical protein C4572_00885 [Candidatus Parcubacteria bacterium]|nr:MAG: hypothetical protein C4572_00885 [Candidatus Parcubacteria bacterium]
MREYAAMVSSSIFWRENFDRIFWRRLAANCSRRFLSSISFLIASARASGFLGGAKMPSFPLSMISGMPPTLEAITGNPAKPASSNR